MAFFISMKYRLINDEDRQEEKKQKARDGSNPPLAKDFYPFFRKT
jgi:hypothetical protein